MKVDKAENKPRAQAASKNSHLSRSAPSAGPRPPIRHEKSKSKVEEAPERARPSSAKPREAQPMNSRHEKRRQSAHAVVPMAVPQMEMAMAGSAATSLTSGVGAALQGVVQGIGGWPSHAANAGSTALPLLSNVATQLGHIGAWSGAVVDEARNGLQRFSQPVAENNTVSDRTLSAIDSSNPPRQFAPSTPDGNQSQTQSNATSSESQLKPVLKRIGIRGINPKIAKMVLEGGDEDILLGQLGGMALNASLTLMVADAFPEATQMELNAYRKALTKKAPDVVASLNLARYIPDDSAYPERNHVYKRILGAAVASPGVSFSALHNVVKRHFGTFIKEVETSVDPTVRAFGEAQRKLGLRPVYTVTADDDIQTGSPSFTAVVKVWEPALNLDSGIEAVGSGQTEIQAKNNAAKKVLIELSKMTEPTKERLPYPKLRERRGMLHNKLGFKLNAPWVAMALTQPRYALAFPGAQSFKKPAWIGDAILPIVGVRYLMRRFPDRTIKELTELAKQATRNTELTSLGQALGLDKLLYGYGQPLKEHDSHHHTAVSDATEGLFGAIVGSYDDIDEALTKAEEVFAQALPVLPPSKKVQLDRELIARGMSPSRFTGTGITGGDWWAHLFVDRQQERWFMVARAPSLWQAVDEAATRVLDALGEIS